MLYRAALEAARLARVTEVDNMTKRTLGQGASMATILIAAGVATAVGLGMLVRVKFSEILTYSEPPDEN